MKKSQIYSMIFLITILIIPFISFATAATPDYVGISEGQEIIWNITIDDDPYEEFYEDQNVPEVIIDNLTDYFFDDELDKDITGWKIKILEIEKEDDEDDDDYVEIDFRLYTREEDNDWEVEDQKESLKIWEYDTDKYVDDLASASAGMTWRALVVADNVKWEKFAEELDDELDDDYDGKDESAGAEAATYMYFFMQKTAGLSTYVNYDEEELDDFTSTSLYNDNGVLMYYVWAYDGDPIIEIELQYRMVYQWWWAAALIAVIAIVIIVIIIIKRR